MPSSWERVGRGREGLPRLHAVRPAARPNAAPKTWTCSHNTTGRSSDDSGAVIWAAVVAQWPLATTGTAAAATHGEGATEVEHLRLDGDDVVGGREEDLKERDAEGLREGQTAGEGAEGDEDGRGHVQGIEEVVPLQGDRGPLGGGVGARQLAEVPEAEEEDGLQRRRAHEWWWSTGVMGTASRPNARALRQRVLSWRVQLRTHWTAVAPRARE